MTFGKMFNLIRKVNREVAEAGYSTVRCDKEFLLIWKTFLKVSPRNCI